MQFKILLTTTWTQHTIEVPRPHQPLGEVRSYAWLHVHVTTQTCLPSDTSFDPDAWHHTHVTTLICFPTEARSGLGAWLSDRSHPALIV
jgi:hypothetical protein